MKNFRSGLIVMMESSDGYNGTGEVVGGGNGSSDFSVGATSHTWAMRNFKPYKGGI